jgi:hypothetical protein
VAVDTLLVAFEAKVHLQDIDCFAEQAFDPMLNSDLSFKTVHSISTSSIEHY